jgi:phosphoribosylamine--glycine ligase
MEFLLWNISGDFLSIAQRLTKEGYKNYSYYQTPSLIKGKKAGYRIVELLDDPFDYLKKANKQETIILVDDNGYGDMFDYLKKEGWLVIGASTIGDLAEHQRSFGNDIFKRVGIAVPETFVFEDIEDALSYTLKQKEEQGLVFKGEGSFFAGSSYTFVAKSKQEMLEYIKNLKYFIDRGKLELEKGEIQKKVDGIELSIAAYFNGEKFIDDYLFLDFEEKKSGAFDTGKAVGCMGQVIKIIPAKETFYFHEYLKKLEPVLQEFGYVGEWDFNNIYSPEEDKFYALEHTSRFGWDSTMGEYALLNKGIGEFFIRLAKKQPIKNFFSYDDISYATRLYIGSVDNKQEDVDGVMFWYDKSLEDNFWHYSVKKGEKDNLLVTDNPVSVFVLRGQDYHELQSQSFNILKSDKVILPDMYFRPDIATRYPESISLIEEVLYGKNSKG